jgi:flagellar basal body-associated protein FliL
MLESGISAQKAGDKKKKLIIGGVVGLIVIVSIILGVTLSKKSGSSEHDGTGGLTENPMIAIYAAEPNFLIYAKDGKGA